ncbi:hypothetical protein [Aquabacterium sp. OR-4]|uniref:hypothetical protein n=1 Tax=Aquabacterium sp. OR-4 TaxID=2978127 RepID=UPI0028C62F50|nr:hypothetical protein [Aquabacterium sp. OR-4]MDT7838801.1 hypothetical protein [Aquabacterium sp. OR-4]
MTTHPALLAQARQTGEDVLLLVDGLDEAEFSRSRLTRHEVRRLLCRMADTLTALPAAVQQGLPEIDWPGWRGLVPALAPPGAAGNAALGKPSGPATPADAGAPPTQATQAAWAATQALVPATLAWLRVYQQADPALFEPRA